MATIKFLYRGTKDYGDVTIRLSHLKEIDLFANTGYKSKRAYWIDSKSKKRNYPSGKDAQAKSDKLKLVELEKDILEHFNEDYNSGIMIDKEWLKDKIDIFFKRKVRSNTHSDYLVDNIQYLIDNASYRKNNKGGIGVSKSRIADYKTCKGLLEEFSKSTRKKYKIKDVSEAFAREFEKWFVEEKGLTLGYARRNLNVIKAACKEAQINGIEISLSLSRISTVTPKNEYVIYLNETDLKKIQNKEFDNQRLNNAKKWILLGCQLGQRGKDLLRLNESNITEYNGKKYFEFIQEKTSKAIKIPIHDEISKILETGFPYKVSLPKFNKAIHDVCELAEINEETKGVKKVNNRNTKDVYPKYKLISSHSLRRSFASNYYGKISTNLLIAITGHATETMFLKYIGKTAFDYADEFAEAWNKIEK
ncbi:phage integrase SAM-like domain-containing protein [Empedobacter sp. R132-2]|uniref:phage integrase SAM-like domain-containing protein n=1 Tax=Empedobacter sp. R132-2 TaxID=2746740 RepID=UPI002576F5AE|nr:phage integrase SAM-like domain-containing protein [Empedobacter sp. R132-2]MDM1138840.1 phage integrase SAM-like domain-containing protein [Empedobacter sp. R132-2]